MQGNDLVLVPIAMENVEALHHVVLETNLVLEPIAVDQVVKHDCVVPDTDLVLNSAVGVTVTAPASAVLYTDV
eukprot:4782650-Pyramimonas_sp.AAC.1